MKNPFSRTARNKRAHKELETDSSAKIEKADLTIAQLEKKTAEIEAERERKRQEREEKKFQKLQAVKRQRWERWLAPVLLILTVLISFLLYWSTK